MIVCMFMCMCVCACVCVCVCGVLRYLEGNQLTTLPVDFCSGCSSMTDL